MKPDFVVIAGSRSFTVDSSVSERSRLAPRRTSRYSLGTVSTLWLKTSGFAATTVSTDAPPAAEIGRQDFDTGRRVDRADRADRFGEMGGAPVGEIVTVDRRQDDELQGHPLRGRAHADGLQRVDRERLAVGDVAEPAGPRADVAEQQEGGGAAGETLAAVRAARLFADRVEPVRAHHGLDLVEIGEAELALANPLGGAHRQRRAHIPSGTTQGDLTLSWRASFVAALSASSSDR